MRRDFTTMVEFGPRLTGNASHRAFTSWLEREFVRAGAVLRPCDQYAYRRWSVRDVDLHLLEGPQAGPTRVATYYPRSRQTPQAGIEAPLVYGGTLPSPSVDPADLGSLPEALAAYPGRLTTWAQGLSGTLGGPGSLQGSVLLVDLPVPVPLTAGAFLPLTTYLHWPGHSEADVAVSDYSRSWSMPGLGVPLAPFEELGVAAVVFVVDRSFEALQGNYLPFDSGHEPLPALYVDRDEGARLRAAAATRPTTRLRLTAGEKDVSVPSVTAVIPGRGDETLIFNTHTDGQGFVEENGAVALVHLARHFGSLPPGRRLRRTLVFACWPGHMSGELPELEGWMAAHPDLVASAAAAMTIEHLGCTEWLDSAALGYHATGENEFFGVWTTQGPMFELARDSLAPRPKLARTALLRPPVQFGVGGAFQDNGVPQIGALAGPEYLLTVSENGDLDKLDEALAAEQIAWFADMARRIDALDAETLRSGDPTLGDQQYTDDPSTPTQCGPGGLVVADAGDGRSLRIDLGDRVDAGRRLVATVSAMGAAVRDVRIELRRNGVRVGAAQLRRVGRRGARLRLRHRAGAHWRRGRHVLVVSVEGRQVLRRPVQLR
ncbi:hypothetical protein [Nocardioides acrostichi]|uniref:Peptidase M28 domain-containing protein n=1 Tax=Nocardioides acrostichi TaxID=2784339 RepID=A0A930UZ53_9ACTN|nr:hypothetical protein [Nocardioides acrostichi]MBF4160787.1 hypothetical protein [Nocardioides acrostichi]